MSGGSITCLIKGCHEAVAKQLRYVCNDCHGYFCENHLHWIEAKQVCTECLDEIMEAEKEKEAS